MEVDHLRCFEAAAAQLNFRQGARRVALSPAAFSERIRQLEDELKVRLFDRTTRSVALTAAGELLVPQARRVLDDLRGCAAVVHGVPKLAYGLRVGTRFELGLSWLTPALEPLRQARPERKLSLYFGDSEDLLRRLAEGLLDAMVSSVRLSALKLKYVQLHPEAYVFVGPKKLDFKGPVDAPRTRLLDVQPDLPLFRYLLDASPPTEVWEFSEVELLGAIAAVRYRVLEGAGVAVLPRYFVEKDLEAGRLKQLLPKRRLRTDAFRLVWREDHPRQEALRELGAELRAMPLR